MRLRFRFPPPGRSVSYRLPLPGVADTIERRREAGPEANTKMIHYLHERAWSVIRWDQQGQTGGGSSSP